MTETPATRQELLALIACDPVLTAAMDAARAALEDDPGHDLGHALRVALWTLRIGGPALCPQEAILAALLHDIVNVPKDDSARRVSASTLCAEEARRILTGLGVEPPRVGRVAAAIRDHSFSRGATPTEPLACALQDADRLEALGAIGIMRCLSTGARMGAGYFHPEDPWASGRDLDDRAWSVDHFFRKLLRLPETMCTARGRAEAARRADHMRAFLAQLGVELGVPAPAEPELAGAPGRAPREPASAPGAER